MPPRPMTNHERAGLSHFAANTSHVPPSFQMNIATVKSDTDLTIFCLNNDQFSFAHHILNNALNQTCLKYIESHPVNSILLQKRFY